MQAHPPFAYDRKSLPPENGRPPGAAAPVKCANKPAGRISGFTLIELLITIAIAGILATLALPSFNKMLANQRLGTAAEELYMSLNFARSEAVTRGMDETVTIASNGTADWGLGWNIRATSGSPSVTLNLKVFQAKKNVQITNSGGNTTLTYGRNGRLTSPAGQQIFYITDASNVVDGVIPRCVIISPSGQPMIRRDNDEDGDCTNG